MARKIRLLMVDDEVQFLRTLQKRLQKRGLDVTAATNGPDALKVADEQTFDLALLDLKMPGMDGEELLARLKKQDPYVEVVILTGHGSIDSAVRTTKLGSRAYLQKPCETEELLEALQNAYRKRLAQKLKIDDKKVNRLVQAAEGDSPIAVLLRLREIEEEEEGG